MFKFLNRIEVSSGNPTLSFLLHFVLITFWRTFVVHLIRQLEIKTLMKRNMKIVCPSIVLNTCFFCPVGLILWQIKDSFVKHLGDGCLYSNRMTYWRWFRDITFGGRCCRRNPFYVVQMVELLHWSGESNYYMK